MIDDIVTRLRAGDPYCSDGHIYDAWANEAADEIERLRARYVELWHKYKQAQSMNANEKEIVFTTHYVDTAEERFQWACALAYAYDMSKLDPYKAQKIRDAWGEYHRHYWSPVVAGSYNRIKPEVPDYPNKVQP